MMAATAMNDSQKPAASTANGSHNTTIKTATASDEEALAERAHSRHNNQALSMISVRCVGTEKPANHE